MAALRGGARMQAGQNALAKRGIPDERIYADKKTGATIDRAGLDELLRYARTGAVAFADRWAG